VSRRGRAAPGPPRTLGQGQPRHVTAGCKTVHRRDRTSGAWSNVDGVSASARAIPPDADSGALEHLKTVFRRTNYSVDGIRAAGIDVGLGVRRPDIPFLLRALRSAEPLSTLVQLFLLGTDVHARDVERALGLDVYALARLKLVERRGNRIRARLHVTPWGGLLIAHDPDPPGGLPPDHIAGPTPAAETLAQVIVRRGVRTTLDLGTGSGILALVAARHSDRVVATDVSRHAIELAALNARLNDVTNIETREGSFFEPVRDSLFGLIVSNPPFVISPETGHVFRDSPLPRDEVSRLVVTEAAARLEEGGLAHVLCNWIVRSGDDWRTTVDAWVRGSGCDALLLHHGTEDPLSYAARWNVRLQQLFPERYPETLDRWLSYYETEGIEAIASGIVILRQIGRAHV
jgi:methylase of polypeptide subunit release factors